MQHHREPSVGRVGLLEQQRRVQRGRGQLLDDLLEAHVPCPHLPESFSLGDDLLQQMAVDLAAGGGRHLSNRPG